MNVSANYFPSANPSVARLASSANLAHLEKMLGTPVSMPDFFEAVSQAYTHVLSQQMVFGHPDSAADAGIQDRVLDETLHILQNRLSNAQLYTTVVARNDEPRRPHHAPPINTRTTPYSELIPEQTPRRANAFGINTRHSVVPSSNRGLLPHQLRQMRGIMTDELLREI